MSDKSPWTHFRHSVSSALAWIALRHWMLIVSVVILLLLSGILLTVWKIPQWQAASWEGQWKGKIEPKDLAKLENDARTTLVQTVGGAILLIGIYFTAKTLRTTQEGQITDRFTKAINQLGESAPEKLAIRLGGIYALARIAKDSKRDHGPIMEILTAYVREHTSVRQQLLSEKDALPNETPLLLSGPPEAMAVAYGLPRPPTDIQAILIVLGKRVRFFYDEDCSLDLSHTVLDGAILTGAHLEKANLTGAHLEGYAELMGAHLEKANLTGAHLVEAFLAEAHLQGASITEAHLWGVNLTQADLRNANLMGADLQNANLMGAHLQGADFTGALLGKANLLGADLRGTNFRGADLRETRGLTQAQLNTACVDEHTMLPECLTRAPSCPEH